MLVLMFVFHVENWQNVRCFYGPTSRKSATVHRERSFLISFWGNIRFCVWHFAIYSRWLNQSSQVCQRLRFFESYDHLSRLLRYTEVDLLVDWSPGCKFMDYYSGNFILLPNFMGSQGIDHKLVTICFSQAMEFGLIDGVLETEY